MSRVSEGTGRFYPILSKARGGSKSLLTHRDKEDYLTLGNTMCYMELVYEWQGSC